MRPPTSRATAQESTDARARMRVQVSQETGKSPFDPSVVREARRRVAKKLDADIQRVVRDQLPIVIAALPRVRGEGRFGDRKVFIATLWDRVGDEIRMTLPGFKRWLVDRHRQQDLVLARADLIAAMPYDLVMRSETKTEGDGAGATFHFVVDPSV